MPTYQYRCTACLHEFEEFQSMSDDPLVKCPECKKRKLVRLISGAGLVFKGSGFYLTDYKKRGTPAETSGIPKKSHTEGSGEGEGKAASKREGETGHPQPGGGGKKEKPKKSDAGDKPSAGKS
jgi:putative FmdB family regulatory protein